MTEHAIAHQSPEDAARLDFLIRLHRGARFVGSVILLPVAVVLYFLTAYRKPCWQTYTLAAGAVGLTVSWLTAFHMAERGRIHAAVRLIAVSGTIFGTLVLLLREGSNVAILAVFLAECSYVALFSHRLLIPTAVATLVSVSLAEVSAFFHWIPRVDVGELPGLFMKMAFILVFFPAAIYFMRKAQLVNEALLERSEAAARAQRAALATIDELQPQTERVLEGIRGVADSVAAQAAEQAATSNHVNRSAEALARSASATADRAAESKEIALRTRVESDAGARRLAGLESGFQEILAFADAVRGEANDLAERAVQTEAINDAIGEIADNLRFLAVNASLEAAKAGEHGKGFGVVAGELKRLIESTTADLLRSRALLGEIRKRAALIDGRAAESAGRLRQSFGDLQAAGQAVTAMADDVAKAAAAVDAIAGAAAEQQQGARDVSIAMRQLDEAASHLSPAASSLREGVERIARAQVELRAVLERAAAGHS